MDRSDAVNDGGNERPSARTITRRALMGVLGVAGVAALVRLRGGRTAEGAAPGSAGAPASADRTASELSCVVTPAQTEGPYFVDERLQRADVRVDPTDGTVRAGVPLKLRLAVNRVDGSECRPVPGALVDIWQCDALGVYSDVNDFQGLFDTRGRKFLRGYQITDANGEVEFVTVYPGWYSGRAVHIHFKVRTAPESDRGHEFTSQLYFDDAVTDAVHALAPYNAKGRRDTLNTRDGIYSRSNGAQLVINVAREGEDYAGTFAIGLRMS